MDYWYENRSHSLPGPYLQGWWVGTKWERVSSLPSNIAKRVDARLPHQPSSLDMWSLPKCFECTNTPPIHPAPLFRYCKQYRTTRCVCILVWWLSYFVCTPCGKIDLPFMQLQWHVTDSMCQVPPNRATLIVWSVVVQLIEIENEITLYYLFMSDTSDRFDIKVLTGIVVYTAQHHQSDSMPFSTKNINNVFSSQIGFIL